MVARSAGQYPNPRVVDYVARSAAPFAPPASLLAARTPRNVVEQACGSVQPGYFEVFMERNREVAGLSFDAPIGYANAARVTFPACLFAVREKGRTVTIGPKDTQTTLAQHFTGYGKFNRFRLTELFGEVTNVLGLDQKAKLELVTAPTFIQPLVGMKEFESELAKRGSITVAPAKVGGTLIGPSDSDCNDAGTLVDKPSTIGEIRAAYPFHPDAVAAAFAWTRGNRFPNPTRVMIIDNGFWGVPACAGASCLTPLGTPILDEPFPRPVFATDDFIGDIGPVLVEGISPINYLNDLGTEAVDSVRGHGTHVTGLALGGPALRLQRERMFGLPNDSWLKLSIGNLAPARLSFPADAEERLFLLVGQYDASARPMIVNLSIALEAERATSLARTLGGGEWRNTLFVVAAGNVPERVENLDNYPAQLGDVAHPNVVTVASVDADGRLSAFTAYSPEKVEFAAPGCRIKSWLTREGEPVAVTGTSQSAPITTFGAAALRALWGAASPDKIRARLAYSGALLTGSGDQARVRMGTRLDLFLALLLRDDVVITRNPDRILLGQLEELKGLRCNDGLVPPWKRIRSLKTGVTRQIFTYSDSAARRCEGTLAEKLGEVDNKLLITTRAIFANGAFQPHIEELEVPVGDLVEFVRAELPN